MNTPILFIVFNRPALTKIVFEKIREAKPERLFISADVPRNKMKDDIKNCRETLEIFENIDWECQVEKLIQKQNMGCKNAVSSAINWFFEYVEAGIILEDDCLPDSSFFSFCGTLLNHFKNDERIMHISGDNFQKGKTRSTGSYYYSKYTHCWGWATWRRAWEKYDFGLQNYNTHFIRNQLKKINPDKKEYKYWKQTFDAFKQDKIDAWGSRWQFSVWNNNGLCILANINLVSNIGFGFEGTHTTDKQNKLSNLECGKIIEIHHPKAVEQNIEADLFTFYTIFYISPVKKLINFISTITPDSIKKIAKKIQIR
jgi:hypothetical protein